MVHVNLSDVGDGGEFEVLPSGVYEATLIDAKEVPPKEEGKFPYINWEFKLNDHPGKAWTITSFSPKALWKMKEVLSALGEDPEVLNDPDGFDLDPTDYFGEEVNLVLKIGTNQSGKERNEVDEVLSIDGGAADEKRKPATKAKKGAAKKKRRRSI
jgi:hypothetical protein